MAMRGSKLVALFTAVALASVSLTAYGDPTAAQKETARALMKDGRAKREKGDHKGALESFKSADAIMQVPTTGLEVGQSQTDLGLLVEARDTFLRVARIPVQKNEPSAFKDARAEAEGLAEKLEARIPAVKIKIANAPEGSEVKVTVDEVEVPTAALAVPYKVNPGSHTVVGTLGTTKKSESVELKESETKDVALDFTGAVPPPKVDKPVEPPPPTPTETKSELSPLTYVGFGLAGVGLIAGSVTGLMAMSKTSTAKQSCDGNRCPPSTHDQLASARSMATISTISFVVMAVGAGVGIIGLMNPKTTEVPKAALTMPPKPSVDVWVGIGSIGLSGQF